MVLSRPREKPEDPRTYEALYDEKILRAIEKSRERGLDPVDQVDTYLLAGSKVEYMVGEKPSPEDTLATLEAIYGWKRPRNSMLLHLMKRGSLDQVKDALGRENLEEPFPVSEKEALAEQENLTLSHFLESVMIS